MKLPIYPDRYSAKEAAEILGVTQATLAVWRSTKRYSIPYLKLGRNIYYLGEDIKRFIESRIIDREE